MVAAPRLWRLVLACTAGLLGVSSALRLGAPPPGAGQRSVGRRGGSDDGDFDFVMVHTAGKVGSRTLLFSINGTVVDTVSTDHAYPRRMKTHAHVVAMDVLKHLPPDVKKPLVITVVRNPFEQQQSLFFQLISNGRYKDLQPKKALHMTAEDLTAHFEQKVPPDTYSTWFSGGFKGLTGVDFTKHEFDHENHQLFVEAEPGSWGQGGDNGGVKLSCLLLRLEDAHRWEEILKGYLPDLSFVTHNIGERKWYEDLYVDFKKTYRFPPAAVAKITKNHDNWHFYSEEEREMFKQLAVSGPSEDMQKKMGKQQEVCYDDAGELLMFDTGAEGLDADEDDVVTAS